MYKTTFGITKPRTKKYLTKKVKKQYKKYLKQIEIGI